MQCSLLLVHVSTSVTRKCCETSIQTGEPITITSYSTHLNYFPSLLWNSGNIILRAYNLKSTEFMDLPPDVRYKGRAVSLPSFRYKEKSLRSLMLSLKIFLIFITEPSGMVK